MMTSKMYTAYGYAWIQKPMTRLAAKSNLWQYKLASTAKHNEWSGYKNKKQGRCRRIKK